MLFMLLQPLLLLLLPLLLLALPLLQPLLLLLLPLTLPPLMLLPFPLLMPLTLCRSLFCALKHLQDPADLAVAIVSPLLSLSPVYPCCPPHQRPPSLRARASAVNLRRNRKWSAPYLEFSGSNINANATPHLHRHHKSAKNKIESYQGMGKVVWPW
jgi:hypothetical protein